MQLRVPGDYLTIMDTVTNADPGEEIMVGSGVWDERIVIDLPITVSGAKQGEPTVIRVCDGDAIT